MIRVVLELTLDHTLEHHVQASARHMPWLPRNFRLNRCVIELRVQMDFHEFRSSQHFREIRLLKPVIHTLKNTTHDHGTQSCVHETMLIDRSSKCNVYGDTCQSRTCVFWVWVSNFKWWKRQNRYVLKVMVSSWTPTQSTFEFRTKGKDISEFDRHATPELGVDPELQMDCQIDSQWESVEWNDV